MKETTKKQIRPFQRKSNYERGIEEIDTISIKQDEVLMRSINKYYKVLSFKTIGESEGMDSIETYSLTSLSKKFKVNRLGLTAFAKVFEAYGNIADIYKYFNDNGITSMTMLQKHDIDIQNSNSVTHKTLIKASNRLSQNMQSVLENEDYMLLKQFASTYRRVIDRFVPMPANVSDIDYIKYGKCCGCGDVEPPDDGFNLKNIKGIPVAFCEQCYRDNVVTDDLVIDAMASYIKRVEATLETLLYKL